MHQNPYFRVIFCDAGYMYTYSTRVLVEPVDRVERVLIRCSTEKPSRKKIWKRENQKHVRESYAPAIVLWNAKSLVGFSCNDFSLVYFSVFFATFAITRMEEASSQVGYISINSHASYIVPTPNNNNNEPKKEGNTHTHFVCLPVLLICE